MLIKCTLFCYLYYTVVNFRICLRHRNKAPPLFGLFPDTWGQAIFLLFGSFAVRWWHCHSSNIFPFPLQCVFFFFKDIELLLHFMFWIIQWLASLYISVIPLFVDWNRLISKGRHRSRDFATLALHGNLSSTSCIPSKFDLHRQFKPAENHVTEGKRGDKDMCVYTYGTHILGFTIFDDHIYNFKMTCR